MALMVGAIRGDDVERDTCNREHGECGRRDNAGAEATFLIGTPAGIGIARIVGHNGSLQAFAWANAAVRNGVPALAGNTIEFRDVVR